MKTSNLFDFLLFGLAGGLIGYGISKCQETDKKAKENEKEDPFWPSENYKISHLIEQPGGEYVVKELKKLFEELEKEINQKGRFWKNKTNDEEKVIIRGYSYEYGIYYYNLSTGENWKSHSYGEFLNNYTPIQ